MLNSFSTKASRLSTKKRDLTMNHRDVPTVEEQESSKGTTITEIEAMVIGGNQKER